MGSEDRGKDAQDEEPGLVCWAARPVGEFKRDLEVLLRVDRGLMRT